MSVHNSQSNVDEAGSSEGLRREIGLFGLSSNLINAIIGSGIFVLPAVVAGGLGAAGILSYLFCGFLIALIMMCFAEAGSKITVTGGAYAYIETAFGKFFGFLTMNLFLFGSSLMAIAAVANALADQLTVVTPLFENLGFRSAFFILIFGGLATVNVIGVKSGITLVKFLTIAKLAPLLILIFWGMGGVVYEQLMWDEIPTMAQIGQVSMILIFAFQGAENSMSVSGEVRNPQKTIPRAILLSFTVVLLIYITIQQIAQGVLGICLPDFEDAPLAEVAGMTIGPAGLTLLIVGGAISMFGYVSGDVLNMPRVIFRASKDEVIPLKFLSLVHPKFATPYVAVILFATFGCFFAITGEFKSLALLSSTSSLLIYLGVALAVIKLRYSHPSGSFKIPFGWLVPLLAIGTIVWLLSNAKLKDLSAMGIALGILSLLYLVISLLKSRPGGN